MLKSIPYTLDAPRWFVFDHAGLEWHGPFHTLIECHAFGKTRGLPSYQVQDFRDSGDWPESYNKPTAWRDAWIRGEYENV